MEDLPRIRDNHIYMSAVNDVGISELAELIKGQVYATYRDAEFLIPYGKGGVVSYFMENSTVREQEYLENGVRLVVNCHKGDADKYSEYLV